MAIAMGPFYHCSCYFSYNIFIEKYNAHFNFENEAQFFNDYKEVLLKLGCDTEERRETLMKEICEEIERRQQLDQRVMKQKQVIAEKYHPLHPEIYKFEESFLEKSFINLIQKAKFGCLPHVLQSLDIISEEKQLYGFPVFKTDFIVKLLEELNHFEKTDLVKERPNSMNKYGVLLDNLGFHNFSDTMRLNYLDPLANILFPEWRGERLDSHKIFSVTYKIGQDIDLCSHYDNSEVTLNVCLGKAFEGGELYFGDMQGEPPSSSYAEFSHKTGYGILHRGQQIHGALPITSGERCNLILWMRSSSVRNVECPMCHSKPKLHPAYGYGDGFKQECKIV